jgi:hypothetical protein
MRIVRLKFVDFYKGFDQFDNWFYRFLIKHFTIEISEDPDFIIYSSFGHSHLHYSCTKIFYTGENERPNFLLCDYAISFDLLNRDNYLRLPLYVIWEGVNYENLVFPTYQKIINSNPKSEFCCFLVSNPHAKKRINFFKKLNEYKKVDSGGKVLNNIGYRVSNKLEFMSRYKFIIAFENSFYPGYVSEKVFEPFFTNTIPIYWGSDSVKKEFNEERILNRSDYESDEALIERIIYLDTHPQAYEEFVKKPVFVNNTPTEYFDEYRLADFFTRIFNGSKVSTSKIIKKNMGIGLRKYRNFCKKILSSFFDNE